MITYVILGYITIGLICYLSNKAQRKARLYYLLGLAFAVFVWPILFMGYKEKQ